MFEIIVLYTPPDGEPQKHLVNRYEFREAQDLADSLKQLRLRADKVVSLDDRIIKSRDPKDLPTTWCGHDRYGTVSAGVSRTGEIHDGGHRSLTVCNQWECINRAKEDVASALPGLVPIFTKDRAE